MGGANSHILGLYDLTAFVHNFTEEQYKAALARGREAPLQSGFRLANLPTNYS